MTQPNGARWRRELGNGVIVSVDGASGVDSDLSVRPRGWVVIEMPDDLADSLAHGLALLAAATAHLWGEPETLMGSERPLAEALYEAAAAGHEDHAAAAGPQPGRAADS